MNYFKNIFFDRKHLIYAIKLEVEEQDNKYTQYKMNILISALLNKP